LGACSEAFKEQKDLLGFTNFYKSSVIGLKENSQGLQHNSSPLYDLFETLFFLIFEMTSWLKSIL
jgi:hypothetical protein